MEDKDVLKKIEGLTKSLHSEIEKRGNPVFERYPLLFSMLGALGIVSVFYGFEGVLDSISFFQNRPFLILVFGFLVLLFTGSLYKRL